MSCRKCESKCSKPLQALPASALIHCLDKLKNTSNELWLGHWQHCLTSKPLYTDLFPPGHSSKIIHLKHSLTWLRIGWCGDGSSEALEFPLRQKRWPIPIKGMIFNRGFRTNSFSVGRHFWWCGCGMPFFLAMGKILKVQCVCTLSKDPPLPSCKE